jgi:diguanylate cyclase (GGDEF)-like protein/PAS domain S-box-containing protein
MTLPSANPTGPSTGSSTGSLTDGRATSGLATLESTGTVASGVGLLAAVTAELRSGHETVEGLMASIQTALAQRFATRCAVYLISTDGARMRTVAGAPDPWNQTTQTTTQTTSQAAGQTTGQGTSGQGTTGQGTSGHTTTGLSGAVGAGSAGGGSVEVPSWQPVTGPIADVLAVRQPIELGLTPATERDGRSFARVVPIWHRRRIVSVIAVVRDAPLPLFTAEDRIVLDAVAERIEHAFVTQDLQDQLLSCTSSPVSSGEAGAQISEALFNQLALHGGEVIFRHRFSAGTEYVSAGVRSVLGYEPHEFLADPGLARRIVHPEDRHLLTRLAEDIGAYDQQHLLRTVTRDGTVVWQLLRARPVTDGTRVIGIEGLATDVTMMKRTEAELSHQARSDPLTNLANRLTLREYIGRSLARLTRHPGSIGLLYLDLTGFKAVNDSLGHPAGDQAIVTVADRLAKVTRREDVVARVGGDEFAVLIPDLGEISDATLTAQRIIASLEMPIDIGGQEVRISTGVGIAVTSRADADVDELLANADAR